MDDDGMDEPTGIDWSEWNLELNEGDSDGWVSGLINKVRGESAEIVTRQIRADFNDEKFANVMRFEGEPVTINFKLVENSDVWVKLNVDNLDVERDTVQELDAIRAALSRLIDRCKELRVDAIDDSDETEESPDQH